MDLRPKLIARRTVLGHNDTTFPSLIDNSSNQDFTCVWLDSLCNNDDQPLYKLLNRLCSRLERFPDVWQCITYMVKKNESEQFLIVVSYLLAEHFIPLIHERAEIRCIYVDCTFQELSRQYWINKNHLKTTNRIFTTIETFQQQLKLDIASLTSNDNDSVDHDARHILPRMNSFSKDDKKNTIQNLSKNGLAFVRFQLIIEILLRMNSDQEAKKTMLDACRHYYRNNAAEQKNITEFQENFCSTNAIWWYTRATFLFRSLNKALGSQDVDYMCVFRYIIKEIHQQLSELFHQQSRPISTTVYRGKIIPLSIVRMLQDAVGGLISMNGFLSTSENPDVSEIYCGQGGSIRLGFAHVRFILEIENNIATKPYAKIHDHSAIPAENELLFSVGTVWRVEEVNENKETAVWNVQLKSSLEDNSRCIELHDYLKKQLGPTASFLTLGHFLYELGEYKHAEKFYRFALDQFADLTNIDRCLLLNNIGCIRVATNDETVAPEYFKEALRLLDCTTGDPQQNAVYDMISRCNLSVCSTVQEISIIDNTDPFRLHWLLENNVSNSKVLNNMGVICFKKGDYEKARSYYEDALKTVNQTPGRYPPDFFIIYNNLANLFYATDRIDEALEHFQLAINSGLEVWLPQHPWIQTCVECRKIILQQTSPRKKLRRNS